MRARICAVLAGGCLAWAWLGTAAPAASAATPPALASTSAAVPPASAAVAVAASQGGAARLTGPRGARALAGHEVFKIVSSTQGEPQPPIVASGAFSASGYFDRATATAVFGNGTITIRRHRTHQGRSGPDLQTCKLRVWASGTFTVVGTTGTYHGLRESGSFVTTISITLAKTGTSSCSATVYTAFRAVTTETGYLR